MTHKLKFISYDGSYPNLCSGELVMELDEKIVIFPEYCLSSGGNISFDGEMNEKVTHGEWTISDFPKGFPKELEEEAERLVNENIKQGCCGGCV